MGRRVLTDSGLVEVRLDSEPQSRVGPLLALAGVGMVMLVGVSMSVVAARSDQPTWAVLFVALTLFVALVLGGFVLGALPVNRGKLRVRAHDGALEVVGSLWARWAEMATAVLLWIGVLAGVMVLLGPGGSEPQSVGPVIILAGFALGVTWFVARFLTGHRPQDALVMRREGFSTRRAGSTESFQWGDVTGVAVGNGGMTVDLLGFSGTKAPFPASELRSDPALVAALLEFYRTHERERSELASGRALDRVRSGDFRQGSTGPRT